MNNLRTNHISVPEIPRDVDLQNDYLLFKTNTTGLPHRWYAPAVDVDNWPRVVQLAWILIDRKGVTIESDDFIIKPEGYKIPFNAAMIHGITNERAFDEGVNLISVLNIFNDLLNDSKYIVAYNLNFDEKVLGAEYIRKGIETGLFYKKKIRIMEYAAGICQIPGLYNYKYPKLTELYRKLFHKNYRLTHDALMDLKATEQCFREMQTRNII